MVGFDVSGDGPVVMLLHSSVSGRRQWRSLSAALVDRFRVVALDLIGYGDTPPWAQPRRQRLDDQAALVRAVAAEVGPPAALVGHSFGATVALCAAATLGEQLRALVLLEPNPFPLLRGAAPNEYAEAAALREIVRGGAAPGGDWEATSARFADYWNGDGTRAAMPEARRAAFAEALRPNVHEWDAVMDAPLEAEVAAVTAATHVVSARDTVATIAAIVAQLEHLRPDWRYATVAAGGHMAPVTRPDLVNPLVTAALNELG